MVFLLCTVPGVTHNLSEHYSCFITKCQSWPQPTLPLPPPALLTQVALVLWLQTTDFQGQFSALMKHSSDLLLYSCQEGKLGEFLPLITLTVRGSYRRQLSQSESIEECLMMCHWITKGPLMAKTCSLCQAWRTVVGNCLWNETDTVAERRKSDRGFRWKESTTDKAIIWSGRRKKNRGTLAWSRRSSS